MKKLFVLSLILSSIYFSVAQAKTQSLPQDVQKLKDTGSCAKCDLSGANLSSYPNANFSGALLANAHLAYNSYQNSNFSKAILTQANLSYSALSGADFSESYLINVNFLKANLSSTNFKGAILTGSDLRDANLAWSNITKEQLAQAKSYTGAILPDGSIAN